MYNLKNFQKLEKTIPEGKKYIRFNPVSATNKTPRFTLSACASRVLMEKGFERCTLHLDSKNRILAIEGDNKGARALGTQDPTGNNNSSTAFTNSLVCTLLMNMYQGQAVAFEGEFEESQNAFFFDLNKPIYL